MAFIIITASFLPKSVNFLVDMRSKSYCNDTNFRGNKFSRILVKLVKLNTRIDTTRDTTRENWYREKTRKVNGLRNSPTKKKNVISFLCREYFSLENIHQLIQLQLPRFISLFPLSIRIHPKFFLILFNYFLVSFKTHFFNVTFLYSLKRLKLKVCWRFHGISKCNTGKIRVKSTNSYHTILKFMPFEKIFHNFYLRIMKINTCKILNSCSFTRISTYKD